jgi:hypothetical protein
VKQSSFRTRQVLGSWMAKQRSCRAGECSPARWSSCRAEQAWGGPWPDGDHKCLWIPGLKGSSQRDSADPRGGNLGYHIPGGAKEQGQRIRDHIGCGEVALWAYGVRLGVQHLLFF